MKMTAITPVHYAGKEHKPGEQFEATDRDARILVAVKKARPFVASQPAQPDVTADDGKSRKGRYRRRDMRADKDGE